MQFFIHNLLVTRTAYQEKKKMISNQNYIKNLSCLNRGSLEGRIISLSTAHQHLKGTSHKFLCTMVTKLMYLNFNSWGTQTISIGPHSKVSKHSWKEAMEEPSIPDLFSPSIWKTFFFNKSPPLRIVSPTIQSSVKKWGIFTIPQFYIS